MKKRQIKKRLKKTGNWDVIKSGGFGIFILHTRGRPRGRFQVTAVASGVSFTISAMESVT